LKLLYFAWVRQKIGRGDEDMKLPQGVTTIAELMAALRARGGGYQDAFGEPSRLRAARNQEHVPFDARLSDNDEIAFFPPVTGG
jgi:molybdopterin synthase sulfur carrier subunit